MAQSVESALTERIAAEHGLKVAKVFEEVQRYYEAIQNEARADEAVVARIRKLAESIEAVADGDHDRRNAVRA